MDTAVYIHIPFCASKCIYCDFLSFTFTESELAAYIQALSAEIRLRGRQLQQSGYQVTSLYMGGGTPTVLADDELAFLLEHCRRYLPLMEPEWTVEANPGTLTHAKLHVLKAAGVNRISLGIQDLCDQRLALLGRLHNAAQARQAFIMCSDTFPVVSVDLMAALPGQTTASFLETLTALCAWGPQHISVYGLKVEEGTPLSALTESGQQLLPDEDTALDIFLQCRSCLKEAGYEQYEIANFAKPGFRSRHNLVYWHNLPYLGLGLGAHSFWQQERLVQTQDLRVYTQQLAAGILPVAERVAVTLRQEMEDTMMLGLRLSEGVLRKTFYQRFGHDLLEVFNESINRLQSLGLLVCDGHSVRLTTAGLPVANEVFSEFIG